MIGVQTIAARTCAALIICSGTAAGAHAQSERGSPISQVVTFGNPAMGLSARATFQLTPGSSTFSVCLENTSVDAGNANNHAGTILTELAFDLGASGDNMSDPDIISGSVLTGPTSQSLNFVIGPNPTNVGSNANVSGEWGYSNANGSGLLTNFISSNMGAGMTTKFANTNQDGPPVLDGPQGGIVSNPEVITNMGTGVIQDEICATINLNMALTNFDFLCNGIQVRFNDTASTFVGTLENDPCPQTGACCIPNGTCTETAGMTACTDIMGAYQGDGTSCAGANCLQMLTGACCFPDGSCTDGLTQVDCEMTHAAGIGVYQGDGSTCMSAMCPQPPATGACCFPDGSCTDDLTLADCEMAHAVGIGVYQGDGSTCMTAMCPQPPATGACCFPDGSCTDDLTRVDCEMAHAAGIGVFQGDGSTCLTAMCPQPPATGACCFPDGSCTDGLTLWECEGDFRGGGTYLGDDTTCDTANCDEITGECVGICCSNPEPLDRGRLDLEGAYCWDTGGWDLRSGQASLEDPEPHGWETPDGRRYKRAADDFVLPGCKRYRLNTICVLMLIDAEEPELYMELFEDCNGCPEGESIAHFYADRVDFLGVKAFGLDLVEVTFDTDGCWLEGGHYWISPVGVGDGTLLDKYFWATAGNESPIALAGKVKRDVTDQWQPSTTTNVKCTDFAFAVNATVCDILCDNGQAIFDNAVPSEISQVRPNVYAADDFVTPPCSPFRVDLIEACVMTNCGCGEFELNLFHNRKIELFDEYGDSFDPPQFENCPELEPFLTLSDPTKVTPLHESVQVADPNSDTLGGTNLVVDAYRLQWDLGRFEERSLGRVLEPGKRYWISVAGRGTDSATDRSFFCMAIDCRKPCRKLDGAKILRSPFEEWEPALLDFAPCGLAFTICGEIMRPRAGNAEQPEDINKDGKIDSTDLIDLLGRLR